MYWLHVISHSLTFVFTMVNWVLFLLWLIELVIDCCCLMLISWSWWRMEGYSTRGRWVRSRSRNPSCTSPGDWHWERPRPQNQGQGHSQSPRIKLNKDVSTINISYQLDRWMTTDDSRNWMKFWHTSFGVKIKAEKFWKVHVVCFLWSQLIWWQKAMLPVLFYVTCPV